MSKTPKETAATKAAAKAETGAPTQVVVTGQPVGGEGQPTVEGKILADRDHALVAEKEEAGAEEFDRVAESGVGYWDDNVANKRYFAKLDRSAIQTPLGTPMIQVRKINPPDADRDALAGLLVLKEDGSFYSVKSGTKSITDIRDPETDELLIPEVSKKKAA